MVQVLEEYLRVDDGVDLFIRSWLPEKGVERVIFCIHGICCGES